jgi:putative ABC transport system substrate-binding protein
MKRLIAFFLIIFFILADIVLGNEIVVLKGSQNNLNEQIQKEFIQAFSRFSPHYGFKRIQPHQIQEIIVSEENQKKIPRQIQFTRPDLILALGTRALKAALTVPDLPIVHLLVISPEKIVDARPLVSGVGLIPSPLEQLEEIRRRLPEVSKIGLVYDPRQSAGFIESLSRIDSEMQFTFLAAHKSSDVQGLIRSLSGKVDLLWMLPDITATNQKTLQSYFQFSISNKVPLLTFSEKLLNHGATLAITFDIDQVAQRAALLAIEMLSQYQLNKVTQGKVVTPQAKTILNYKMIEKLDVSIIFDGERGD